MKRPSPGTVRRTVTHGVKSTGKMEESRPDKISLFTLKAERQQRHSAFFDAQLQDRNQEIANFMQGSALNTGPSRSMRALRGSFAAHVFRSRAIASCCPRRTPPIVPNEKPPSSTPSSPPPRIWALPCPSHSLSDHRKASGLPAIEDPNLP